MKVCMVTTFYPPYNFGGDGFFVERLSNALVNDGHEVHVVHDRDAFDFVCRGMPAQDSAGSHDQGNPKIKVHTLGDGQGAFSFDLILRHQTGRSFKRARMIEQLLNQNFDVIHYHNISLMGGPDLLRLGDAPVKLCTLHDHWFVCATHVLWRYNQEACQKRTCISCTLSSGRPPQLWRYTGAVAKAAAHVNTFLSPSRFARQSHLDNGFPAPIRVLPHFYPGTPNPSQVAPAPDTVRPHPRPYFLFVGRLEKLKGAQILVELFKNFPAADLLIAGSGTFEPELRQLAGHTTNVHFLGRIAPSKLQSLYQYSVSVLVPSLCYETFGLVALDAFANGAPAIVHDLGALPEIVKGGGGLVYRNEDELKAAMESLLSNPQLRDQMGNSGLENLRANYTQQRHLSQYYDMISEFKGRLSRQEVT